MIRVALIADSHLPAADGSAQERCLLRAAAIVRRERPDAVLVLGDMTARGEAAAARRVRACLEVDGTPVLWTPGNRDLRHDREAAACLAILSGQRLLTLDGWAIAVCDTSERRVTLAERDRLQRVLASLPGPWIVATHAPPESLPRDEAEWLMATLQAHGVRHLVCGHRHFDKVYEDAGCVVHLFRGLDPAKTIGGGPCLPVLTLDGDRWDVVEHDCGDGA